MEFKTESLEKGELLKTLEGNSHYSFAISSDNQNIASGCIFSHGIKLWDVETGKLIKTFFGHTKLVTPVLFSSNNRQIISGSHDKTIKLWDVESEQLLMTFQGHTNDVGSVAISSDSTTIVSSSYASEIIGWNVVTGKSIWTIDDEFILLLSVAISSENQVVGGCWDGTIQIWDLKTGELIRKFLGHTAAVNSVAISSVNKKIVSGCDDHTIKIWEFESGKLLNTLVGHDDRVRSVAISSDNQLIVSGSVDGTIKLWDFRSGKTLKTFEDSASVKGLGIFKDNRKFGSLSEMRLIKNGK